MRITNSTDHYHVVTHIVGDDHKCAYEGDQQAYKQLVMITNVHMTLVMLTFYCSCSNKRTPSRDLDIQISKAAAMLCCRFFFLSKACQENTDLKKTLYRCQAESASLF